MSFMMPIERSRCRTGVTASTMIPGYLRFVCPVSEWAGTHDATENEGLSASPRWGAWAKQSRLASQALGRCGRRKNICAKYIVQFQRAEKVSRY
jgi:hypothetical protein